MPMRKSHAKSRNGCNQCKTRRVKCDEQLPNCTRCVKRNENCSFATISANSPSNGSPHSHDPNEDRCPRQHLELELMHHWTTNTHLTIDASTTQSANPLAQALPKSALEHDYLMDILFSFTALHLASLNPSSSSIYITAALHYRDRGMQRVAPLMQSPSPADIFAVFWFSVLVGMVTMAHTVVTADSAPTARHFTAMLAKLGQLWRGTRVIADMASTVLELNDDIYTVIGHERLRDNPILKLDDDTETHLQLLQTLVSTAAGPAKVDPMYETALHNTRKAFQTWQEQQRLDDVMAWAPELGHDFAGALSDGAPVAVLCTLVYGVALNQIDGRWWAKGAGRSLVNECSMALRSSMGEWGELIAWARRRVGLGVGIPVAPQDL